MFSELENPSQDDFITYPIYSLITKNSRCITVLFTLYLWNSQDYVNVISVCSVFNQTFEFLPTGVLVSNPPKIKLFKANIYSSGSLFTIDVIRCIIIVILLNFLIIEIIEKKEQFKKDFFRTISLKMFYSLFTILIFLINFILKLVLLKNEEEEFFDPTYSIYKVFINLNSGLSFSC